jgi:hypothetical protein
MSAYYSVWRHHSAREKILDKKRATAFIRKPRGLVEKSMIENMTYHLGA